MNLTKICRAIFPTIAAGMFACLTFGVVSARAATTGWNQTTSGTYDYNDPNNWVDGTINGLWDSSANIPSSQTITFDADTVLSTGWTFLYEGSANESLRGTGGNRTVTLGGDILHNTVSSSRNITIGSTSAGQALNIDLGGATRMFTVGTGRTLGFVNAISNGAIVSSGGTLNFSGTNTYTGTTTITSGVFSLNGTTGSAANSDFTLQEGPGSTSTLVFNSNSGSGLTRAKSVTLNGIGDTNGVSLNVNGNAGSDSVDTITGALTAAGGFSQVTINPNPSSNARLDADNFVRGVGSTILFRGANLGVSSIGAPTDGNANIQFAAAPALVGGGGAAGTTTVSLLKGAYGDTSTGGSGFSPTGGLVTYDADKGVRVLGGTEYKTSITDGQTALDNVRLSNSSGSLTTVTLNSNTTINSLSLNVTAATSPITLGGTGTLQLNSGVLYAWSADPATAGAEMTINNTLDLNGTEGVVLFSTSDSDDGVGGALLRINGAITNDGGNGVTFNGSGGVVELAGTEANTYTGVTTINRGSVRLNKGITDGAIVGHVVLNGGSLQNTGNEISNDSDITINGGTYYQKSGATNSGSGASDTFRDLTMTGGRYDDGASGTSSGTTNLRNANLMGGAWNISRGHKTTLSGSMLVGGTASVNINRANDTSRTTILTINGDLTVVNSVSDPFTPFTFTGGVGSGVDGALMVLNGDLTFTGNSTNSNTVLFDATAPTSGGNDSTIALQGVRTFNIGDGAADVDLRILPRLAGGGLIKTGGGTLALDGASIYGGATTVNAGTLLVGGSLGGTSGVSVADGARLGGTGTINATISGAGSVNPGDSPGIMTATQVDPSGGLDFNFEFTLANSLPTFASTENDILRLTDATPFTQTLTADNVMTLYLDLPSLTDGDILLGGFYTDGGDPLSSLAGGSIVAYLENDGGSVSYLGKNYDLVTQGFFSLSTVANTEFSGSGFLTQFSYTAYPIPEPSSFVLLGLGVLLLRKRRRNNR